MLTGLLITVAASAAGAVTLVARKLRMELPHVGLAGVNYGRHAR